MIQFNNRDIGEKKLKGVSNISRKYIVVKCHNQVSHFEFIHTVTKFMKILFIFLRYAGVLRYHVRFCSECLLRMISRRKRPEEFHHILSVKCPFKAVSMDHTRSVIHLTKRRFHSYIQKYQ